MKQRTVWTISLALLSALLAGLYWWQLEERTGPPNPSAVSAPAPVSVATPAASAPPAVQYPVLAEAPPAPAASEPITKPPATLQESVVEALGEKAVLQWLEVDALAHRIVVTVDNMTRPHAPARYWPVHPTAGRFTTVPGAQADSIAPENAKRYVPFVAWVETLDTKRVVALYRRNYGLFQSAYENLGYPGRYFNDRLIEVIDHLLATPVPAEPIAVRLARVRGPIEPVRPWVLNEFANEADEERSSGQKWLMRIGNDNAKRLQIKLREVRAELTRRR